MSYIEDIKKRYAEFSNHELLSFAEKNSKSLTYEALTVLKEELAIRGLAKDSPKTENNNPVVIAAADIPIEEKLQPINVLSDGFEDLIRRKISTANFYAMIVSLLMYGLPILFIIGPILLKVFPLALLGLLMGLLFNFQLKKLRGALKESEYWLDLIRHNSLSICGLSPL